MRCSGRWPRGSIAPTQRRPGLTTERQYAAFIAGVLAANSRWEGPRISTDSPRASSRLFPTINTAELARGRASLALKAFAAIKDFSRLDQYHLSGGQLFTIQEGQGTAWTAKQKASATVSGSSFNTSDPGTGRTRGSSGVIVPWAVHAIYCSFVDDAGNFDYYTYVDTLLPEGGLHPYTKDQACGAFYATMAGDSPSMMTIDRLRMLEGIVRGSSGTTFGNPDKRVDDIESRLASIETWANSAGHFGTPPAVGSGQGGSVDTLLSRGDA